MNPLLTALGVLLLVGVPLALAYLAYRYVRSTQHDEADDSLQRMEEERMAKQNARIEEERKAEEGRKLREFYAQEEAYPARERMRDLARGSDAPNTAWMRDLLTKYQFRLESDIDGRSVRLVDTKYPELDHNSVAVDLKTLLDGGLVEWRHTIRSARHSIRKRAIRAGIEKAYPRRGNPGKGATA